MSKKAQVIDLMFMAYILFMIAVIGAIAYFVVKEARTTMQADNIIRAENLQMVQDFETRMPKMTDSIFIFALVGISVITMVAAFFVMSHPVFYIFMAIILAVLTWFNALYANVYQEFVNADAGLLTAANSFTIIPQIMRWFPLIILGISVVIAVLMTAKGRA